MSQSERISGLLQQFWTIAKAPHDPTTKAFLDRCESHVIEADGNGPDGAGWPSGATSYRYFQTGSGPTVLLVHGVHSNLGSMVAVAEELLKHGYRVVLFDAPAHGEASGTTTDPVEVREVIRSIAGRLGDVHAIVAHSLGGLWALSAWSRGVRANVFVSISAPATLWYLVEKFAEFNKMDADEIKELAGQIESRLGGGLWTDHAPLEVVKTIDIPGLIVHGTSDQLVPSEHAGELHSLWRGSRVELIAGADHYGIIGSPQVRELVPTYLQDVS